MRMLIAVFLFPALLLACNGNDEQMHDRVPAPVKEPGVTYDYYREKREVGKNDTLLIYGGTKGYLEQRFGQDTIVARVSKIVFYKMAGLSALLELEDDAGKFYSLELYYRSSSDGYDKASLFEWDAEPGAKLEDPLALPAKMQVVEEGLIFKKM